VSKLKQLTAAVEAATGTRWCTHCNQRKYLRTGGDWIVSANGRTRRWKCGECMEKIKNREKLK
jgi:hypothetical protein